MSTLEKTIELLKQLPEQDLETTYSFVQTLPSQRSLQSYSETELHEILQTLVGAIPDTGKTLDDYKIERIKERYEITH